NAAEAGLFLLFATVNPELGYKGITAFLIERDFPGFRVGKKEDKLGIPIANAAEAGLVLLFATVNPELGYKGITAFLIERDFPGFRVGKKEDKLGIRASSTCELILDNCRVPAANVVGV